MTVASILIIKLASAGRTKRSLPTKKSLHIKQFHEVLIQKISHNPQ